MSNVCGSYAHLNFSPYKLPFSKNAKALHLYCIDSQDTNICVKTIQWGKLWYNFPVVTGSHSGDKKVKLPESTILNRPTYKSPPTALYINGWWIGSGWKVRGRMRGERCTAFFLTPFSIRKVLPSPNMASSSFVCHHAQQAGVNQMGVKTVRTWLLGRTMHSATKRKLSVC